MATLIGWFTTKAGLYFGAIFGVVSIVAAVLTGARSAGRTAEKAEALKRTQEQHDEDAKTKADVDARRSSDNLDRLQRDWSQR